MKKRVVVICPGRGTYTKETLGYLRNYGGGVQDFIADIDERRRKLNVPTITELDSADIFKPNLHTKGEHASALIYASSYADFMAIDRARFEIVAVTGNSMGWYLAAAFGGSLDWAGGFEVVNTMGSMMKEDVIGGQVIYPVVDEKWVKSPKRIELVRDAIAKVSRQAGCECYVSIDLGGYAVIGATKAAIPLLLKALPVEENYPFQLINHAAFHTPLLKSTSNRALELLKPELFARPEIPLIDGRGCIWSPYTTDVENLYRYTLVDQVVEKYNFTADVSVALKEFAPDHLVLLGPGSTLGGAIGQILIENDWRGLKSKQDFTDLQAKDPFLFAMGRPEQRALVTELR